LAQGPEVEGLERRAREHLDAGNAVAVSSGTAALELVLRALGAGEGGEVIIPSYVCTAVLNAVLAVGSRPVLADADETHNLCPHDVSAKINSDTKAVIVTHTYGTPADMAAFAELEIPVVEDCAQGLGSRLDGKPLGSFGRAAIFSFYATKPIAGGEGGMVVCDDRDLADAVRDLRQYDECEEFRPRHNFKMSDIHGALARSQFEKLDAFTRRRREIARRYDEILAEREGGARAVPRRGEPNFYRYVVDFGCEASRALALFEGSGVCARKPIYRPLHVYMKSPSLPRTEHAWHGSVSVPIYPGLTPDEEATIMRVLEDVCNCESGA